MPEKSCPVNCFYHEQMMEEIFFKTGVDNFSGMIIFTKSR
jgi:hypothetical protein